MVDSEVALARTVLIHGPISRAELGARLHLSAASLSRLTRPLLDSGVIVELPEALESSIGRPSRPLAVSRDAGTFVGIKLTGDRMYAAATDIYAEQLEWAEQPIANRSPEAVIAQIIRVVRDFELPDLSGVGVSLGGDVSEGHVVHAPFLDWSDVDLAIPLTRALAAPVSVENDVVALAEAEQWFGVGRDMDSFAIITIGIGVGYGLVIGGDVVRPPGVGVGSAGHIPLADDGPVCPDGHRGCARALLTSESICAQVGRALGRTVTYDEVLALADAGEPAARRVVNAAGDALGRLIGLASNFSLQPAIVLAGEGIGLYPLVADRVAAAAAAGRDPRARPVHVYPDTSGFAAWARGAAAVSIQAAMLRISASRRGVA